MPQSFLPGESFGIPDFLRKRKTPLQRALEGFGNPMDRFGGHPIDAPTGGVALGDTNPAMPNRRQRLEEEVQALDQPLSGKQKLVKGLSVGLPLALSGIFGGGDALSGAAEGMNTVLRQDAAQKESRRNSLLDEISKERGYEVQEGLQTRRDSLQREMEQMQQAGQDQRSRDQIASAERIAGMPARPQAPAPAQPFTLSQGQKRFGPEGNLLAEVEAAQRPDTSMTETELFMKDPAAYQKLLQTQAANRPAATAQPFSLSPGQQRFDASGKPIASVPDRPPSANNRPPNVTQSKALGFYDRLTNAAQLIDGMEKDISAMGLAGQARMKYAPNVLQSDIGQNFNQAANDFINAALRRESGAAISQSEYSRFSSIYFPQPGDRKEVLEQKKRARANVIESIKREAGPAFNEAYGDTPPPPPGAGNTNIPVIAPDGTPGTIPVEDWPEAQRQGYKQR